AGLAASHPAPGRWSGPVPGLLAALREAARSAARGLSRPALASVLLRGEGGQVIGTDGRQLLVQSGFDLPWEGDVLVPALPAFGLRELGGQQARVGRSGGAVLVEAGPWSLALKAEDARGYPDISKVIPDVGEGAARFALHPEDAALALR